MFLMESPLNDNFPYERFQNYFNWTMTYRRDSDFYRPYGWVAPKNWTWHYPKDSAEQNWSQYFTNTTHSMLRVTCAIVIQLSNPSKRPAQHEKLCIRFQNKALLKLAYQYLLFKCKA